MNTVAGSLIAVSLILAGATQAAKVLEPTGREIRVGGFDEVEAVTFREDVSGAVRVCVEADLREPVREFVTRCVFLEDVRAFILKR